MEWLTNKIIKDKKRKVSLARLGFFKRGVKSTLDIIIQMRESQHKLIFMRVIFVSMHPRIIRIARIEKERG